MIDDGLLLLRVKTVPWFTKTRVAGDVCGHVPDVEPCLWFEPRVTPALGNSDREVSKCSLGARVWGLRFGV